MSSPLVTRIDADSGLLEITLDRPKANIVDAEMIGALSSALSDHDHLPDLKAVMLGASGPNFSFGASVEEHLPGHCDTMLQGMHALVLQILEYPVPVLAWIRGQCLGGGLEVASASHLLFATPDARLGQPEIKLGVIAPAASCLLPELIGYPRARDLLLSGRSIPASKAKDAGLVHGISDDPEEAARSYFKKNLQPLSAAAIRLATQAVQGDLAARTRNRIEAIETLYLQDLMKTHDAVEGLRAFMEKREPNWENR